MLGSFDGSEDGLVVGEDEGDRVGIPLGHSLGRRDTDGNVVGLIPLGSMLGAFVGCSVGL